MSTRAPATGIPFRCPVKLSTLDEKNTKIVEEIHSPAWFLGGSILGFVHANPHEIRMPEAQRAEAWLLYQRLFPEYASRLLKCMSDSTGETV